jgi:hypothetical protein
LPARILGALGWFLGAKAGGIEAGSISAAPLPSASPERIRARG